MAVILSSWCKDWSWWIKGKETRKDSVWEDVIDGGHLCDQEQWYWERTGKEKHDCAGADYTDDESLSTLGGVKMGCDNLTCFPARYFFFSDISYYRNFALHAKHRVILSAPFWDCAWDGIDFADEEEVMFVCSLIRWGFRVRDWLHNPTCWHFCNFKFFLSFLQWTEFIPSLRHSLMSLGEVYPLLQVQLSKYELSLYPEL